MKVVLQVLDQLWNLKPLTGWRTKIAQSALIGLSAYQALATADLLIKQGIDLPDIPTAILSALTVYFGGKLAQFAREHGTPAP